MVPSPPVLPWRRARGGRGGGDDYDDDEGDAGKGRKKRIPTGTVKGIGKRLFGKSKKDGNYDDDEEEDADELEGEDRAEGGGEAAMDFNPILRPPLAPSSTQASTAGEPGTAVPSPPPSPPPSCRNLDDDMEMEDMSFMEEGSGGGVEVAVPDDELLLRGAEDLKRQSDAVLSPMDEENEDEGEINANAGADAGADKSLMPAVVFNDMENQEGDSSLSHSAMIENETPTPKPKQQSSRLRHRRKIKRPRRQVRAVAPDEDGSKDEAVAASMTGVGDLTGDMMSDILGVTMPGDETTIGELEDTAAKLAAVAIEVDDAASPAAAADGATGAAAASPAANLDGEEQEEEEKHSEVVDSGRGVVGAGDGHL